ncbi:MmgE/PrpD family protein [Variovorax sp. J31P207]|uniref:MmgE/PrpD family protein n=1 Tax=Variovorax sp. J31P207 TaxID=3053510 RepID=UPI002579040C|nr:MmgE/PrpD family protein [Variovorax sp. J31P207]MDM0071612.1 MmgE/PrpD family protein [Variovorax sp. J31P207]
MSGPSLSRVLAEFTSQVSLASLPPETVGALRRHTLDTLGAALAGALQPEPTAAWTAARTVFGDAGRAALWGRLESAPPGVSALVNGTAAHALELDDASGCDHSGAVVLPAVLAALALPCRDQTSVGEDDLLCAILVGYEVGRRVMEASGGYDGHNGAGWHSTGTCGVFGAAAAVARLLRCDAATTAQALGIAGSFASGTWAFLGDGAMTKRMHPGHAASSGLLAVEMARAGLVAPAQIFEADWGGFLRTYAGDAAEPGLLTQALGKEWRIHRSSIKPYASCRGTHAAVEAVIGLRGRFATSEVSSITVTVTPTVSRMCGNKAIGSFVDAQMSLPYAVAIAALHGAADLGRFDEAHRRDPAVNALMQKVEVIGGTTLPSNVAARLAVHTDSGLVHERAIDVPLGSPGNPLSDGSLLAKYHSLADPMLGRQRADALADRVLHLGAGPGIHGFSLMTQPSSV